MRLFKVSGYISQANHIRLVTLAETHQTTRTAIASKGIELALDELESGRNGFKMARDKRPRENRERHKK